MVVAARGSDEIQISGFRNMAELNRLLDQLAHLYGKITNLQKILIMTVAKQSID